MDARHLKGLPVAVIDTETTGLDPSTASIVDVAVVHTEIGSDRAEVAFSSLVKPPISIPADSTRITGIDDATVAAAPPWRDVSAAVLAACEGRLVVAYNAPYDYRMLVAENGRSGPSTTPAWPWLDLLVVRKATRTRGRPGRLAEIAAEFGIVLDAHGATGDALTTAYLVTPMLRQGWSAHRAQTVGGLLEWQRGAALAQEREYADYCQRRGDARAPSCGWHECEGVAAPFWEPPVRSVFCGDCGGPVVWTVGKDGTRQALDAATREPHAHRETA